MARINLAQDANEIMLEVLAKKKVGDILGLQNNGQLTYYKLVRINRKSVKYWAEPVTLYTEDQVTIKDAE